MVPRVGSEGRQRSSPGSTPFCIRASADGGRTRVPRSMSRRAQMGRIKRLVVVLLGASLAVAVAVSPAAAYGNGGGSQQLYQATASMNCNNPSLCGSFLGGFWAWAEFDANGTFDAEVTFCSHL